MTLFQLKVTPITTYELDISWEHLTKRNLEDIERVKATFLKRAFYLSKTTPSRLVYVLARQSFYIEDLRSVAVAIDRGLQSPQKRTRRESKGSLAGFLRNRCHAIQRLDESRVRPEAYSDPDGRPQNTHQGRSATSVLNEGNTKRS